MPNSRHLTLTSAPFRPTLLSIPPSPHSPLSPLYNSLKVLPTPFKDNSHSSLACNSVERDTSTIFGPAAPNTIPFPWIWQCHICRQNYPLGATRRCLDDGHRFCAGEPRTTDVRGRLRRAAVLRRTRSKACVSEFDYAGWKAWGEWRRSGEVSISDLALASDSVTKSCSWSCDYPSECRWAMQRHLEIKEESRTAVPVQDVDMFDTPMEENNDEVLFVSSVRATSFEEILGLVPRNEQSSEGRTGGAEKVGDERWLWRTLFADAKTLRLGRHKRTNRSSGGGCHAEFDPLLFIIEEEE